MLQEWFFVIGDDGVSANLFQSVIDAVQVAPTIVDDCNGMIVHGNPFPRLDSAASLQGALAAHDAMDPRIDGNSFGKGTAKTFEDGFQA